MEFAIDITETLKKQVRVDVVTLDDAIDLVKRRWKQGEYILDSECFAEVDFSIAETKERK